METEEFLTAEEARKALKISRAACYKLIQTGAVPSVRLGRSVRVPASALRKMAEDASRNGVA